MHPNFSRSYTPYRPMSILYYSRSFCPNKFYLEFIIPILAFLLLTVIRTSTIKNISQKYIAKNDLEQLCRMSIYDTESISNIFHKMFWPYIRLYINSSWIYCFLLWWVGARGEFSSLIGQCNWVVRYKRLITICVDVVNSSRIFEQRFRSTFFFNSAEQIRPP